MKALREANRGAAEVVVAEARTLVPYRTGRARASLRAVATAQRGQVRGGGAKAPYFGFLDYGNKVRSGGAVGRGDSVPRPYARTGRIVYPALARQIEHVIDQYRDAVDGVLHDTGLK